VRYEIGGRQPGLTARVGEVSHLGGTFGAVPSTKPRIQVTIDEDLAVAVAELGGGKSRSRVVHDLALRGAEAIRAERLQLQEGLEFLRRLDAGEDDRFDFSVSARLHAER
jgi:Arc/MetJ family transcription regulator